MKKLLALITTFALSTSLIAGEIIVKGSDTMLNLVQRLAEGFAAVRGDVTVSVAGGGSGVGITAITNREVDIANASRAIKSKEISAARAQGVNPVEIVIALDGLAVIVNSKNPVKNLTVQQIGAIYRGEIKNWNEVGGPNKKIVLYGRQPNSGTFVFFREEVVKGEYASYMRQMNGNAQIVDAVKNDEGGIGYVGLGYIRNVEGIRPLAVAKSSQDQYISPLNEADVKSGAYPLTRPLYQYTNGKPKGQVLDFIRFELSPEGQKIVEEEGFVAVTQPYIEKNSKILQ
ncbi:MAG: PstS family phosphate ABC transporter substrate-binding protein [candidate division WOR-3 bacterium]|jgi:phosphate transport system substrate-binding protein|nr:PstS family phosphate ABC transporter substrate-binding protein [candidate division WOR-3 bacterium]MCR4423721.1 PstS family phosphate ABC transporter substrate-binding protein [candidate division WOR-3 bacterium]MDH7519060.1 PstS family phosphate ABC transporter substrate-binding protein [bacterium]